MKIYEIRWQGDLEKSKLSTYCTVHTWKTPAGNSMGIYIGVYKVRHTRWWPFRSYYYNYYCIYVLYMRSDWCERLSVHCTCYKIKVSTQLRQLTGALCALALIYTHGHTQTYARTHMHLSESLIQQINDAPV